MSNNILWYPKEAWVDWTTALPVGNGRLGAMVYGSSRKERIQLNEDTLWTGSPYSAANPGASEHLPQLRQLMFEGRIAEAERFADAHMMARPRFQMSYQPAGWAFIETRHRPDRGTYKRALDLQNALATVSYQHQGVRYHREVIAAAADNVIGVRMWAEDGKTFDSDVSYDLEVPFAPTIDGPAGTIVCEGHNRGEYGVPGGLEWTVRLKVVPEGGAYDVL